MYIRITENSRGEAYYHFVESFRRDGKIMPEALKSNSPGHIRGRL